MKIYKYILDSKIIGTHQLINIPRHGVFLHAAMFMNQICMWFCVTEGDEFINVPFIINYTGDELHKDSAYLATVISHSNQLVYHISVL